MGFSCGDLYIFLVMYWNFYHLSKYLLCTTIACLVPSLSYKYRKWTEICFKELKIKQETPAEYRHIGYHNETEKIANSNFRSKNKVT